MNLICHFSLKWRAQQYIEYLRHLSTYTFAEKLVIKKTVLEIGCGTEYGADRISQFALITLAIDIWKEGIKNCEAKYKKENLIFLSGNGLSPLLRKFLPSSPFSRLNNARNALKFRKKYSSVSNGSFVKKFSLNDFRVHEDCAKRCLDLYGICVKV